MSRYRRIRDVISEIQLTELLTAAAQFDVDLALAPEAAPGLGPDFAYQRDHLLVSADVDLDHPRLRELSAEPAPRTRQAIRPTTDPTTAKLMKVSPRNGETVIDVVKRLGEQGLKGKVAPNHLVSICPVNLCAGAEPLPLTRVAAQPVPRWDAGRNDGEGVRVHVVDTGLIEGDSTTYPLIFTPVGPVTWDSLNDPYQPTAPGSPANGLINLYGGHGLFVAGVVKWFAPGVSLHEWKVLHMAGAVLEDALADALMSSLDQAPDIISLSAGCTTFDDRENVALRPVYDRLREPGCTTLLVAAAGNDGNRRPFYPAAMHARPDLRDAVISVGALRSTGEGRACFSNYGDWVRVFAPGEGHVNAFPPGRYRYHEPQSERCRFYYPPLHDQCRCVDGPSTGELANFERMARWSGTSFATPLVAGRIASFMTEHGQPNARLAAQQFLALNTVHVADPEDHTVIPALRS